MLLRTGGPAERPRLAAMRAAILTEVGRVPEPGDFEEPEAGAGQLVVEVLAAGVNPVDIAKASGSFYAGPPSVPCVVGGEGVGRLPDGRIAYFDGPEAPFGSIAERSLVAEEHAIPLPAGLDPALAVAFGVAGLAAWLSLEWRARLQPGETVLVLGASGVVGQLAVQAAGLMGAGRVVAAARSQEGLRRSREGGADATVSLEDAHDLPEAFREAAQGDIQVVVDPVWGAPAAAAVEAAGEGARIVQLGQSAGPTSQLSSAAIRSKLLTILGHTNFKAPAGVKRAAYSRMAEHGAAGELSVEVERVPLEQVGDAWKRQPDSPGHKLVIVPGPAR